jgi:hypothetical protein
MLLLGGLKSNDVAAGFTVSVRRWVWIESVPAST